MVRVATCAVAVGIIVTTIAIAIIAGFKSQIESRLSSLSGHIVVTDVVGVNPASLHSIRSKEEIEDILNQNGAVRVEPYILRGAIACSPELLEGVVVKGIESELERREVVISTKLARDMSLEIGTRIELLFNDQKGENARLTFKVADIITTKLGEIEDKIIMTNIETLRRVNGWDKDEISGYEVWLDSIDNAEKVAREINHKILYTTDQERVIALWIKELYPSLFDWLTTHDINGVVVIIIMLVVAIFNMATALLILVLESSRMVGILKSLGMDNRGLTHIFLHRAGRIIIRGLAWGNTIGLLLCFAQQRWGVLKLDASGYMLATVPIELEVWWIIALNIGFATVTLIIMTLPLKVIASISPDEIVKYR